MDFTKYVNHFLYVPRKVDPVTWQKYMDEELRINEQFKVDVLEDIGIEKHPMANRLFDMAWDRGHSSGFQSVYEEACELSQLLVY